MHACSGGGCVSKSDIYDTAKGCHSKFNLSKIEPSSFYLPNQ